MGFGTGLLVDTVLVQTLGVTSLLYIAIGYWSGRLRELRDPAHGLVPLAAGAAATAVAGIGMTLIQFLLGVDAPVSWLLAQQIFITVLVNTLIALPVYTPRAPGHPAGPARRSAPPAPPRLHDRRSQPAAAPLPAARADLPLPAMTQPPEERRPPLTPQLALRVAVVGSFALAMFAIIFFRLWFLQVLSGHQYLAQASQSTGSARSRSRPRAGEILDRNGAVLVASRKALAVQISPPDLPVPIQATDRGRAPAKDRVLYRRLAQVLDISTKPGRCKVSGQGVLRLAPIPCDVAQQLALLPYADVTIKTDVSEYVQYYLAERQDQFPGVNVQQVYLRNYPLGTEAAQLFGTVGPISAARGQAAALPRRIRERDHRPIGARVLLRPLPARPRRRRPGPGQRARPLHPGSVPEERPIPGHNLTLSLDVGMQRVGQSALQESIDSNPPANGGAFVALNPDSGEVYAMGSLPTFNPNIFTKSISAAAYKQLNNPSSNFPLHQPGDPERRADGLNVQADHRHRGAGERRLERERHLRRHGPVLHQRPVPAQLRPRRRRLPGSGQRAARLLRRLLLQPRREDQRG